jgi:hypothetical protein
MINIIAKFGRHKVRFLSYLKAISTLFFRMYEPGRRGASGRKISDSTAIVR